MVRNVLDGRTADGAGRLDLAIPFTKNQNARDAIALLLDALITHVGNVLPRDAHTALTAKLLAHLTRTGSGLLEITEFPLTELADAIRENPDLVTGRANIAAMLRTHRQRNRQAAAVLKHGLKPEMPPRRILWQSANFRVEEATDPRHLQQDSCELNHCVGTTHNPDALEKRKLSPDDPEAVHCLHYWMKIRSGQTRILTLTHKSRPLVTIEYDTRSRAIVQMEGSDFRHPSEHTYFPALCDALFSLKGPLDLTSVPDLLAGMDGLILTRTGSIELPSRTNINDALLGIVELTADNFDIVETVSANPLLTLDTTELELTELARITRVQGSVHSLSSSLTLPSLAAIGGDLWAPIAQSASLPNLSLVGRKTSLNSVLRIEVPHLETISGSAEFANIAKASFPRLRHIGGSAAFPNLRNAHFPALATIGNAAHFTSLTGASLPSLRTIGTSAVFNALTTGHFPELRRIGHFALFPSLTAGHFPRLEFIGDVADFHSLTHWSFPSLKTLNGVMITGIVPPQAIPASIASRSYCR
jgi:hypothetical protein